MINNDRRRAEYNFPGKVYSPSAWDRVRLAVGAVLVVASLAACVLLIATWALSP